MALGPVTRQGRNPSHPFFGYPVKRLTAITIETTCALTTVIAQSMPINGLNKNNSLLLTVSTIIVHIRHDCHLLVPD